MQYQRNKENIPGSVPLPDQHRNWMGSIMSWNPSSIQTNQHGWRHNLCVSVLRTTENIFNGKLSNGNVQWGEKIVFYVIFAFTYQDVKFCIYIFKKYFPINSVIMISTILPRATFQEIQNRTGIMAFTPKDPNIRSCWTTPAPSPSLADSIPLGHF